MRWFTSPVKTPADLFTQEFIVGAAGAGSSLAILPTVLNRVLGTKFRIVEGYQGLGDAMLAVERGELQGACASYGQFRSSEQLIRDGRLLFLLRAEEAPIPDIPDVPSIFDLAKTDEQRALMLSCFPAPNSAAPMRSRRTCPKTASASCARRLPMRCAIRTSSPRPPASKMDMSFTPPDRLEQLVGKLYQTPPDIIETVKKLLPNVQ